MQSFSFFGSLFKIRTYQASLVSDKSQAAMWTIVVLLSNKVTMEGEKTSRMNTAEITEKKKKI